MVGNAKGKHGHADLHSSHIAQDEKDVAAMADLIKNCRTDRFADHMQLSGISTGAVATTATVREAAYADFKNTLLESQPLTVRFNDKLKKQKLKTFSALSKTVATDKDTETVPRADRNFMMIIIAESRNLQMQVVLKHSLGPLPASLACNNGFSRKTNKAQLGKELEKLIQPTVEVGRPSAYLIDGMALFQKLKVNYLTFGEIADKILSRVLCEGEGSN